MQSEPAVRLLPAAAGRAGVAAVLQRALQDGGSWALAVGDYRVPGDPPPLGRPMTTATDDDVQRYMADTLTITDNRTGKTVRAADPGRHDPRHGPAQDQGRRPTTSG